LVDLLGAVRPGVAGVWDQRGNRAPFLLAILIAKYVLLGVFVTTP
jgi:hypothetical protein